MSAFNFPDDLTSEVVRPVSLPRIQFDDGAMSWKMTTNEQKAEDVPLSLWHVAESWNDDPSLFVGFFEAVTAEQAIDLAVAESIRVDPQFPREKSELVARLESHHKNESGVWIPVSCEGR